MKFIGASYACNKNEIYFSFALKLEAQFLKIVHTWVSTAFAFKIILNLMQILNGFYAFAFS